MSKAQSAAVLLLQRYPLACVCTAISICLVAGIVFRAGALSEAQATALDQEAEGKRIGRNIRNASGLEDQLKAIHDGVARLESMLIKVDDVSGNQEFFYRLESAAGVSVIILRPAAALKNPTQGSFYQAAGFNVVVEGGYSQVIAFLRALERGPKLHQLTDFTLQRSSTEKSEAGAASAAPKVVLNLNLQLLASK